MDWNVKAKKEKVPALHQCIVPRAKRTRGGVAVPEGRCNVGAQDGGPPGGGGRAAGRAGRRRQDARVGDRPDSSRPQLAQCGGRAPGAALR